MRVNIFLGINYFLQDKTEKAIDAFLELLHSDEEFIETYLMLGSIFRRRGEVDRAIRIHETLLTQ